MEGNKQKNIIYIVVFIVVLVIGLLVGYVVGNSNYKNNETQSNTNNNIQDNKNNNSNVNNDNNSNNNQSSSNEENIPYLEGLESITYYYSQVDELRANITINDKEKMRQVLSIIENRQEAEYYGGGAYVMYLLFKYQNSEIKIDMTGPRSRYIIINDKTYEIQSEEIYKIFGYQE